MSADWVVLKFGGTSVSSAQRWETIAGLLRQRREAGLRPLIVHSALATVSNRLEGLLRQAMDSDCSPGVDELAELHFRLAGELGLDGEALLEQDLAQLRQLLAGIHLLGEVSPRIQARLMGMGELMATRLGAAWLQRTGLPVTWLDARDLLTARDMPGANESARFLTATCSFDPDPALATRLAACEGILLTQGFIARSAAGEPVLLGRGGSDTSAAYFAAKLSARALEIWTDVPGMFSANPRIVPGARLLRQLSYEEAQEIASTGGSVLHPRSIGPCRVAGIPLRVLCTSQPELPGTLVSRDTGSDSPRVKAISGRTRITLVSMDTLGMWQEAGFLAEVFRCFSDLGLSVDLVSTSESNVTVTLDTGINSVDAAVLGQLRHRLERLCRVSIIQGVEVVSLVGRKIRATLHEIGPALEAFQEHRIHLVSQSASDLNLSFVVEEGQAGRLIQKLHAQLVGASASDTDSVFGETWQELQVGAVKVEPAAQPWWQRRRGDLLALVASAESAYVYDLPTIDAAIARLKSMRSVSRVFFAVKANNQPVVLRRMEAAGVNFECVSPGEIRHVLGLFPHLDRQRILYTPNFAPRDDYAFGLEADAWLTLDNLYPLRHWQSLFAGRELFLRVDPGQGRGHHQHVRTAGAHSKFGIPLFELEEAHELVRAAGARVVGLHAHTGSGILIPENWVEVGRALTGLAGEFPELRYLDLGGGLGVPERRSERPLDIAALDEALAQVHAARPDLEIWLEPGRYLVAEAGVLLARVTQTKGKGAVRYVGISTGMNSLIRPALYGAYHEIANLTRLEQPIEGSVSVVGPICETGDRLGSDRLLPDCAEGDVLLIANAGAYGHVMSSSYNLRDPAMELALE
ncbi:MAG: bifunctional aspartate kinase/diaminopimelate decarboxylase [Chromatiales bacterium]|nr:bifunctional aspartate kinase/diaminopimelate decarboxylase [Chromatiales bacterium]